MRAFAVGRLIGERRGFGARREDDSRGGNAVGVGRKRDVKRVIDQSDSVFALRGFVVAREHVEGFGCGEAQGVSLQLGTRANRKKDDADASQYKKKQPEILSGTTTKHNSVL